MFWSGNFIVVRELNFLLKEDNVTLSQVLEADDILQECKADNKALMQFLTRPDILAELITLITEEPPANEELAAQYRHASIACEVLTSPLSSLSDRLSLDTQQMNRLCDFITREPPLNPLLASYFSKTIEMLLERNPKQDWYLYHIVCLRVLDFFKSRRDFLPNLLRHIATSAIADTFNYFIRLDDLFNKIVMEWLDEHQFIECLIQIICGTYMPEGAPLPPGPGPSPEEAEKGTREPSEKYNHTGGTHGNNQGSPERQEQPTPTPTPTPAPDEAGAARRRARCAAVASANACALLCDLVATGCAAEGAANRSRTSWALVGRLAGGAGVRALLQAVFTSAGPARAAALVHGARLLRHLLDHQPVLCAEGGTSRSQVELAVAPHLPLLHQALLRDPATYAQEEDGPADGVGLGLEAGAGAGAVGAARVQTAALLAHLASSEVEEVSTTMLTLGTPGVLVDMFFRHPDNNFLHAQLLAFCRNALANPAYRTQYANHLVVECDLLTRLMDAFEDNENIHESGPRAGYMGHVTLALSCLRGVPEWAPLPAPLQARYRLFAQDKLEPTLHLFATPLGGTYPSENTYEVENSISDQLSAYYDANVAGEGEGEGAGACAGAGAADSAEFLADGLGLYDEDNKVGQMCSAKSRFLELADQRFDEDMWDCVPDGQGEEESEGAGGAALREVLGEGSPWGSGSELGGRAEGAPGAPGGESWAHFDTQGAALPPVDPFAHYWPYEGSGPASSTSMESGAVEGRAESCGSLATNLLTAMSGMSPADLANIVNANLDLGALPPADLAPAHCAHPHPHPHQPAADTHAEAMDTCVEVAGEPRQTGTDDDGNIGSECAAAAATHALTGAPETVTNALHKPINVTDKVTNVSENVTNAPEPATNSPEIPTIAPGTATNAHDTVTHAPKMLTSSIKTADMFLQRASPLEHSSTVATAALDSIPTPSEEPLDATRDCPVIETKDFKEITDKINDITLQDKCGSSPTPTPTPTRCPTGADTELLEASASEAAER